MQNSFTRKAVRCPSHKSFALKKYTRFCLTFFRIYGCSQLLILTYPFWFSIELHGLVVRADTAQCVVLKHWSNRKLQRHCKRNSAKMTKRITVFHTEGCMEIRNVSLHNCLASNCLAAFCPCVSSPPPPVKPVSGVKSISPVSVSVSLSVSPSLCLSVCLSVSLPLRLLHLKIIYMIVCFESFFFFKERKWSVRERERGWEKGTDWCYWFWNWFWSVLQGADSLCLSQKVAHPDRFSVNGYNYIDPSTSTLTSASASHGSWWFDETAGTLTYYSEWSTVYSWVRASVRLHVGKCVHNCMCTCLGMYVDIDMFVCACMHMCVCLCKGEGHTDK